MNKCEFLVGFVDVFVRVLALIFASTLSAFGQAEGEASEPDVAVPELVGVSQIGDEVFVNTVSPGQRPSLTKLGAAVGSYKLVAVDPEGRYVDFEREGQITRVWMRRAEIVTGEGVFSLSTDPANVAAILAVVRRKAAWVGFDELTEKQKDGMLRAHLDHILRSPELTPAERAEQLTGWVNQERALHIGPKGISAEEGAALGMSPDKIAELNGWNRMGSELEKLGREEGKPPTITIE